MIMKELQFVLHCTNAALVLVWLLEEFLKVARRSNSQYAYCTVSTPRYDILFARFSRLQATSTRCLGFSLRRQFFNRQQK